MVTLKPGEEVRLDVTVHRRPDYDKGVSLDVMLRHLGTVYGNPLPPGVTIVEGKSKTLLGTGSTGAHRPEGGPERGADRERADQRAGARVGQLRGEGQLFEPGDPGDGGEVAHLFRPDNAFCAGVNCCKCD